MRIDISLLPALAAAFMLVFARIGAMVMLLPGFGETNIPVRIKLAIALLLTLIILPLHRAAYHVDMHSMTPLLVLMVHEIVIGIVLGATARVTLSALQVAGSVIAQQLGLGFVTAVDPTQGQQGLLIGNFLTMLGMTLLFATDSHHLVIAALNDSYAIFSPGEMMPSGDVAALATRAFAAAFKIGMQLSAPFLVFGLVFNIGLGVLARLMPQMQVYFVGVPLSIFAGFLILALVITAMMGTFLDYFIGVMHELMPLRLKSLNDGRRERRNDKTEDPTQKRLDDAHERGDVAKSQEINTWFVIAGATLVLSTFSGLDRRRHPDAAAQSDRQFLDDPHRRPGLLALAQTLEYAVLAALGVPLLMLALAAIAGNMVQHRLVWSAESLKPKFSKISPAAGAKRIFGKQAAANFAKGLFKLIALGAVMTAILWPERHRLEVDGAVRPGGDSGRHHQPDAASAGRRGGDARGGRDRRLFLPVPAMVRAAEDVAAGDEGGVQAVRRRPAHQGPDPAVAPGAHEEAHDGRGAQGLGDHHQPDPLFGGAVLRTRHVGAGLRRQGRRQHRVQDQGSRQGSTTSRSSRTCRWRARSMPPSRSTRKSRSSTTTRSPRSSAT